MRRVQEVLAQNKLQAYGAYPCRYSILLEIVLESRRGESGDPISTETRIVRGPSLKSDGLVPREGTKV